MTSYSEDAERRKGIARTKDGELHEADMVIAADGIGSRSAELIQNEGSDGEARNSGYALFRATYPAGKVRFMALDRYFH